jgi:arginase
VAGRRLTWIRVPYDSGRRDERMGRGPLALARHGLAAALEADGFEVETADIELEPAFLTEIGAAVELSRRVARAVGAARRRDRRALVTSGNCNTALGTVTGIADPRTTVLWFDAHGDFNTPETTPSGFFDGMCGAMLTGRGFAALARTIPGFEPVADVRMTLVGTRDLDPGERAVLDGSGVRVVSPAEARDGAFVAERIAPGAPLYLHVDLDVLDPAQLQANSYATADGLTVSELTAILSTAAQRGRVAACSVTSWDPGCDEPARGVEIARAIAGAALR